MSQNMMSVSSLNTKIKSLLEATFMHTLVEGEVASVTYHTSGHLYFSIKDDKSSIKCVMWRSSVAKMKFRIEKGMHIVVDGSLSVYTPRGEYQFQSVRIEPYGQGALALAYEQLKNRLQDKGYFDAQRKKLIPKYIKKIALVTAKDSAALHDMLKIIDKRWRLLDITIIDTLVQGTQAKEQIAKALHYADTLKVDVVVLSRGGGSTEDLWAFNEEIVADAIFGMKTPTVSAIGHEVDRPISDFVADLRSPTPSAAMEMILPDMQELLYSLDEIADRFKHTINQKLIQKETQVIHLFSHLKQTSPQQKLKAIEEQFMQDKELFYRAIRVLLENKKSNLPRMQVVLKQQKDFIFQKNLNALSQLETQFKLANPMLKVKEGWGEVIVNGSRIALRDLKKDDIFIVQDVDVKVESKVISSTSLVSNLKI